MNYAADNGGEACWTYVLVSGEVAEAGGPGHCHYVGHARA